MKNLFLFLALLWVSACAAPHQAYTAFAPTTYYVNADGWAYRDPTTGAGAYPLATGKPLRIVGYYGNWRVFRLDGRYLYVPTDALVADPGLISPESYSPVPEGATHNTYMGPRGGRYYYNGNGNKQYVTPQSTIDRENIQTGPRGGQYYINSNGRKTYIKH